MNTPEIYDEDRAEIAGLIDQGNTGGILDREDGIRISWELKIEAFES
ncbi:MAG: hypothetical protein PHC68_14435 [Syntrophorhabdaceae bacterium]|nr:hypothetical protein [Syntrophorhabdaceae bacterium]